MELDRARTNVGGQVSKPYAVSETEATPEEQPAARFQKRSGGTGYWLAASIAGSSAIIIGAFGAHGLQSYLPETGIVAETVVQRLQQFDTGARYHLAHAIVLLVLAAAPLKRNKVFLTTFALFIAGIVFFSGSLYLLVLLNQPVLGAITPIGGVCWIVAWSMLAFGRSR